MPHDDPTRRLEHAPIGDLIDYIVRAYHRPIPIAIARIAAGVRGSARARVERLGELFAEHMREEEELVFPWLRSAEPRTAGVLVRLLEHDHRAIEDALGEVVAIAAEVGGAFAAATRELDRALHELLRLEDSVLFPRVLAGG